MVKAGDLLIEIKAETAKLRADLKKIKKNISGFSKETRKAEKATNKFSKSLKLLGGAVAIGFAIRGFKSIIKTTIQYENSLLGLSSVADAFGSSQKEATEAAQTLAQDGLVTVSEAAEGLKNLLAAGFGLPRAIKLMEGFKDSAAFNRQGTLAFGEAIVGATQGIKNQNSIMVDNAGITKNLSVILKEYGFQLQDLSDKTKGVEARTALFNGLMQEIKPFMGDAETLAGKLSGKLSALSSNWRELNVLIGTAFQPAVDIAVEGLSNIIGKSDESGLRGVLSDLAQLSEDWKNFQNLIGKKKETPFLAKLIVDMSLLENIIKGLEASGVFKTLGLIRETIALGGAVGKASTPEAIEARNIKRKAIISQALGQPGIGAALPEFTAQIKGPLEPRRFGEGILAERRGEGEIIGDPFFSEATGRGFVNFQPIINITFIGEDNETRAAAAQRLGIVIIDELEVLIP